MPQEVALHAQVRRALKQANVGATDRLLVAVSGGLDSCVLLDLLLSMGLGPRVHMAHLDHQLRPSSRTDAQFVEALAHRCQLPCTVGGADVAAHAHGHHESLEMAARSCRYEFLRGVAGRTGCGWIVLAHHADDQAETVLLRLLRGASGSGLAAMRVVADRLLRPLLQVSRQQLRHYAVARDLDWCEDPSNHDIRAPRNRIRHQLLPHLQRQHNPRVVEAIARAASLLGDEDDFLRLQADAALRQVTRQRHRGRLILENARLAGYHIAVQRRVLREIVRLLAPSMSDPFGGVGQLLAIVTSGATPMRLLGADLRVQNTGRWLVVRAAQRPATVTVPLMCPGRTSIFGQMAYVTSRRCGGDEYRLLRSRLHTRQIVLDDDGHLEDLYLRCPRNGDRLRPLGMGGHSKKLSDCFIDAGWPRILREDALVLTRGRDGEILWVAGLVRSEHLLVRRQTRRLLHLCAIDTVFTAEFTSGDPGN